MLALLQFRGQFILWLSLGNVKSVSSSGILWIRESAFDNMSSLYGYNVISKSKAHCGHTCFISDTCNSFVFKPGQQFNCQLHDDILNTTDGLLTVQNAAYYIPDEAFQSAPTSAPTLPPPPFPCPPDDTIFRTVLLENGDNFTYKVVKTAVPQSQAIVSCTLQGSFLARVTTVAKMNMLLQLTRTCPGYTNDYYVDGSNAGAANFTATDAWRMANGDLVPMSNDFWEYMCPNNADIEHCLRMRAEGNYLWDDVDCSIAYYFVCEK